MSEIFGAVGSIASAAIQAGAIKDATKMQIDALEKARKFMYDELDPSKVNLQALDADITNAKNRLALQAEIDPDLLATRYETEARIRKQAGELGLSSMEVQDQAVQEALAGGSTASQGKQALIDAALQQLSEGATLPSDVQAELVRAGLEKSGMVTGAASPKGIGGLLTRQLLGSAAIQLQQQRQQQAAGLLGQAQNLESSRAQILGQLFPNLATTQLNTLAGQGNVLTQSNAIMPNAGLSGNDVANLWLARVGASTSLSKDAANAAAAGKLGQAQAWQTGFGSAINFGANALPSTSSVLSGMSKNRNEAAFNDQFG